MAFRCATLFLLVLMVAPAPCQAAGLRSVANPIRKVVTMLQSMQKKVEEEGKLEKKLFDKFMCYCSAGGADIHKEIEAFEDKVPALQSSIKADEGKVKQAKEDLKTAKVDKDSADSALKEATAIRQKDEKSYKAYMADAQVNLKAITKARKAIESGLSSSFLQTDSAQTLRHLVEKSEDDVLGESDRQDVLAFLSGSTDSEAPGSNAIVGILQTMEDNFRKGIEEAKKREEEEEVDYEGLTQAKDKELHALQDTIEDKTQLNGALGVEIVQLEEDLDDTQSTLAEDKKFVSELQRSCDTKRREWDQRQKTRAEELVALGDTIKILNDDDALDLFKKTLPSASASLLQVTVSSKAMRSRAMRAIQHAKSHALKEDKAGLDLLTLALAGKKSLSQGGFDKVIKMCDDMVDVLKTEQADDDKKKEYCSEQLDLTEDKKKSLERTVDKMHNVIRTNKDSIQTIVDEVESLKSGIGALDRSVADATDQRKKENAEYKELMASDSAAKEVLTYARERLNKFYNPKSAQGGAAAAFVQVAMRKNAPGPPPETWDAYNKKGQESSGVISMIDLLIKDLDKELTEAEVEEKDAQSDYETMMTESAEKRRTDTTSLTQKTSAKADMETEIEESKVKKVSAMKEVMATAKYLGNLHMECDWLLQYYEERREARVGEIDAIQKAKAVLNGADYSLVQIEAHSFLRRGKQQKQIA